jgi:2-oxoglutarate dehydrogenase E1 component
MTPKSLLRHPRVTSSLEDCARGTFQRVLPNAGGATDETAGRVLLCSGKIYFDLLEHRIETKRDDVAIMRLEQLYPLRREMLEQALSPYPAGTPVFWVQEEPANMGAGNYFRMLFGEQLFGRFPLGGIARATSATSSTGSSKRHKQEQTDLILRAFGPKNT